MTPSSPTQGHVAEPAGAFLAYVGSYSVPNEAGSGGIFTLEVSGAGDQLRAVGHTPEPQEAGYLVYAPSTRTLYAVDERKADGRGAQRCAAVHALSAGPDGSLTWLNSRLAPGPFPTYLDINEEQQVLVGASHGSFDHIERLVRSRNGTWDVEYLYDDSCVLLYRLEPDGRLGMLQDVDVMSGHGKDPNFSPQAGGHGQASGHAHCAVIDPSGRYVLVADKGTDQIHVYTAVTVLEHVHTYQFPPETGPRHIAFDATGIAYVTLEFASELASMRFNTDECSLELLDQISTVSDYSGFNEPADVRVHPGGLFVYANNRGEDSLAWFEISDGGRLARRGDVRIAHSIHPGLAARSFAIDPTGTLLLLADRPADLVRSYRIDQSSGALSQLAEISVPQPAFISLAEGHQ